MIYKRLTLNMFVSLLFLYIGLLITEQIKPGFVSPYLDLSYLLYAVMVFGMLSLWINYQAKKVRKAMPLVFLASLILLGLDSTFNWSFMQDYQTHLIVTAIGLGVLTFWSNRNRIDLQADSKTEKLAEERRKEEFEGKFPRVKKLLGLRWFVRWMYKEGWVYSVGLLLLVLIGGYLRVANLSNQEFHHDEFYTVSVVKGYLETGDFVQWDFVNEKPGEAYTRNFGYTWLVAQFTKVFGFDEFGFRIAGAIIGTLTIILVYLIFKKFTSRDAALIAATIFTFNEFAIYLSRFSRSYVVFLFVFLLLVYASYKSIEALFKIEGSDRNGIRGSFYLYRKPAAYNILTLFLFLFSYHLSPLTILFILPILAYFLWRIITTSIRSGQIFTFHTSIFLASSLVLIAVLTADYFDVLHIIGIRNIIDTHFRFDFQSQSIYIDYLFTRFKSTILIAILSIFGALLLLLRYKKQGLFILLVTGIPLLMMVYIFDRFEDFRYVLFLVPFVSLIISVGLVELIGFTMKSYSFLSEKHTGVKLQIICVPLILGLIIFPTFPGVYLPPITHVANADWVGDQGKDYIHRRVVAGELKEAFAYLNQYMGNNDALIVDEYFSGSLMYFDSSLETDVYLLGENGDTTVIKSGLYIKGNAVPFWNVTDEYEQTWVLVQYTHLHDQEIVSFLIRSSINRAPDAGIMQFDYNSYYRGKELYWPNIFLVKQKKRG